MVAACITAAVVLAAAIGLGGRILRFLRTPSDSREGAFSAVALGLGALSLAAFAVGAAGGFYRAVAWAILAGLVALFRREIAVRCAALGRTARRFMTAWRGVFEAVLFFALVTALAANFVSALAPPTESDSLTLHLVVPRDYMRAHRMVFSPDNWDSAMALGPHLLYTLAIQASGTVVSAAVLHLLTGWILMLWVWQFTRARFGPRAAYIAACLFYTMPMISHLAIAPMVDMFFALYAFAACVWLLAFMETRAPKSLMLAAAFAAFSAGVKYTGLVIAAAVVAAAAIESALSRRLLAGARACATAAFVAAALSSPYYIRNYVWTANPFFPTLKSVFGGPGWDDPRWQSAKSGDPRFATLHHSTANLLLAPWLITTDAALASGGLSETVAPALLVSLPLAPFLRSRRKLAARMGLYAAVAFALTYWLSPRPRSRYFLSVMPIASAYAGAGALLLKKYSRPALAAGRAVILASVLSGAAITLVYSASFVDVVLGLTPAEAFLEKSTDFYREFRWMEDNLPAGSKVAVGATSNIYYLSLPSIRFGWSSGYTLVDTRELCGMGEGGNVGTALARMKALGITHLFLPESALSRVSAASTHGILARMSETGRLVNIYSARGVRGTRNPVNLPAKCHVAIYRVVYYGG